MMTDWVEVVAGEENQKYRRAGLVLKTFGWLSICWASMISIWIWMGAKAGSNWWLWGTIGLLFVGAVLIGIGSKLQDKAARMMLLPTHSRDDVRAA